MLPFRIRFFRKGRRCPVRCMKGPAISRITTCRRVGPGSFTTFVTTGRLRGGPIVTLLTNDQGRRVGSGLPSVLGTTSTFPSCRLMLTNTPNVAPRCCRGCIKRTGMGVVFKRACHVLRRTSTTLIASKATALRATLFHIPRIIYCRAPVKGIVSFLQHRVLAIGCVSLIGLVTSYRIIGRLITSAVAMGGVRYRLTGLLRGRICGGRVLAKCSCITRQLKPTNTPYRTTRKVIGLLGGWLSFSRWAWDQYDGYATFLFVGRGAGGREGECRGVWITFECIDANAGTGITVV